MWKMLVAKILRHLVYFLVVTLSPDRCLGTAPPAQNRRMSVTDRELLQIYIGMVPFLAEVCGPGCEVVVHDVTDPEHSLIAIRNSVSGRGVGDPMTDLAREIQKKGSYTDAEYLANYSGKSKEGEFLSSTYYIKNEGRLIGLLCINKDMATVQETRRALQALLERFNLTAVQQSDYVENLDNPMTSMMHNRIAEIIAESGVAPARMSLREKVRVVHRMNDEGVMMMKGAVAEIAAQLQVSVPTVYRYLNKPEQ